MNGPTFQHLRMPSCSVQLAPQNLLVCPHTVMQDFWFSCQ